MLISFDTTNKSKANTGANTATTLSWTHTVASTTADDVLIVAFADATNATVSGINWDDGGANQAALTLIKAITNGIGPRIELWALNKPTAKTATIKATFGTSRGAAVAVVAHFGNQGTTWDTGTTGTGSGTAATVTITDGSVMDALVMTFAKVNTTEAPTIDAAYTQVDQSVTSSGTASQNVYCVLGYAPGSTSQAGGGTWSTNSRSWAEVGVPLNAANPVLDDALVFAGGMGIDLMGGMIG